MILYYLVLKIIFLLTLMQNFIRKRIYAQRFMNEMIMNEETIELPVKNII